MSTTKRYDLAVKTGEYRDRDGNNKARWTNIGVVLEGDRGGMFILLDRWFNPAGVPDFSDQKTPNKVMIAMFEPREDDRQGGGSRQSSGASSGHARHSGGTSDDYARQSGGRAAPPQINDLDDDIHF